VTNSVYGARTDIAPAQRQQWMGVLARAGHRLSEYSDQLRRVEHRFIRPAETGMVMVRGRMGGRGAPFNLGEMTVTRAAVRLEGGEAGVGYVAGRDKRHAELAAAIDAMMQSQRLRPMVETAVVEHLAASQEARKLAVARRAAATKVDFFTMVRTRGPN